MKDTWRDTYDNWKTRSDMDDMPEQEPIENEEEQPPEENIRLVLVDAWKREVSEVTLPVLDLESIYDLLECRTFEAHRIPGIPDHVFYCDEEGKIKRNPPPLLVLAGFNDVLRGNLLIFKDRGDGNEASATVSVQEISDRVLFEEKKKWRKGDQ